MADGQGMALARSRWRQILLLAGPPTAWMAHLLVAYMWVPAACRGSAVPLHVATAGFAGAAGISIALGLPSTGGKTRSSAALVLGGIFVLAILLQGAAIAVVDPCA